jgi:hypothetical protein
MSSAMEITSWILSSSASHCQQLSFSRFSLNTEHTETLQSAFTFTWFSNKFRFHEAVRHVQGLVYVRMHGTHAHPSIPSVWSNLLLYLSYSSSGDKESRRKSRMEGGIR